MPRRVSLLILAAAILLGGVIFLLVEFPHRRADHPAPQPPELGPALQAVLSRPEAGAASIHLFKTAAREWHIQAILPLERYAALERTVDEAVRAASAHVVRKEREQRDGTTRFLWEARGGPENAPSKAVLLFICPKSEAKTAGAGTKPEAGPIAAIIIDDVGYNMEIVRALSALGKPLTVAVLPSCPHTADAARAAAASGMEVMLHLPLEALAPSAVRAPGTIDTTMSEADIERRVAEFLDQIPSVRGVNNHAGSKATEDPAVMDNILKVIKERGLYFIDSRTSRRTVAFDAARALGVPTAARRIFLDQPPGADTVRLRLAELFRIARKTGSAVAIGHARPDTVEALRTGLALADQEGVRLVFASEIVR